MPHPPLQKLTQHSTNASLVLTPYLLLLLTTANGRVVGNRKHNLFKIVVSKLWKRFFFDFGMWPFHTIVTLRQVWENKWQVSKSRLEFEVRRLLDVIAEEH
eukprot:5410409-Amphidinium_carterae.2